MTELIPDLFIGNWHEARDADERFYVITVASDSEFIGDRHFKLIDGPRKFSFDLSWCSRGRC